MILEEIAEATRQRVEQLKEKQPLTLLRRQAEERSHEEKQKEQFLFTRMLSTPEISFITEVKKASPSKGLIAEDFPYLQIAEEYEKAGAFAISVLTEPQFFLGSNQYLKEIAEKVTIPVLRKDFTIDPYMIYEAKTIGADAVLLICSLLDKEEIREYIQIAKSLGMSQLVEAHDEREIEKALDAGAEIIGVNNRNLKDFSVDIKNSIRLRKLVPDTVLFVSESGMKTREDIEILEQNKTNAVLIGETLMRCTDKKKMLSYLSGREC